MTLNRRRALLTAANAIMAFVDRGGGILAPTWGLLVPTRVPAERYVCIRRPGHLEYVEHAWIPESLWREFSQLPETHPFRRLSRCSAIRHDRSVSTPNK